MANKRTVDPTAEEASSRIIGLRVTDSQVKQIAELCEKLEMKRSVLIRQLIRNAYNTEFMPEPF